MPSFRLCSLPDVTCAAEAAVARSKGDAKLGALPEWNLADLYPAMDSPAFAGDLARMEHECKAFADA